MGDNPKTTQLDAKKMPKDPADHPSDSDESVGYIECTTCGVSFSDGKTYEAHMQGKKHQRKVAEAKLAAKNSAAADKEESGDDDDDDDDSMYCEVCDKRFSGYISYMAHIKGSVHAKNIKKKKLMLKQGNMADVLDDKESKSDDDENELLPKPYARCNACQKEFSGPEPYESHVRSAVHKKKVKQSRAVENLKAKYEDETKNSDGEEFFSKCDVCQKSFSGVVPYKTHMESSVHKKNLEKKKIAEEVKEFHDGESGYVCKECKKSFSDPLAFKCHLKNNSHEKRKAKNALREFLKAHPEIAFVYPYRDDEDESDSDDSDSNYYLICKLCKVSFSGPESAQDHVKSNKHLSAKKEKELLKKQKKNSEAKSNDRGSNDSNHPSEKILNDKPKSPENSHADDFELI